MKKYWQAWKSVETSQHILTIFHFLLVITVTVAALLSKSVEFCGVLIVIMAVQGLSRWKRNKAMSVFYLCNAAVIAAVSIILW